MRRVIAALIVVGLTVAVILLWPSPTAQIPPDTVAAPTTTTTMADSTTTTVPDTTSTTAGNDDSHVVETVEQAEEILRQLWFGWFEGIYNQDEDRIREVVATQQMLEAATRAFGASFTQRPSIDEIHLDLEILRSDSECLVVWQAIDITAFRGPEGQSESVQVLRTVDGEWRFTTSWMHRDDLWEADCDAELQPLP